MTTPNSNLQLVGDFFGNRQACGEARALDAEQRNQTRNMMFARTIDDEISGELSPASNLGPDAGVIGRQHAVRQAGPVASDGGIKRPPSPPPHHNRAFPPIRRRGDAGPDAMGPFRDDDLMALRDSDRPMASPTTPAPITRTCIGPVSLTRRSHQPSRLRMSSHRRRTGFDS